MHSHERLLVLYMLPTGNYR